MRSLAQGKEKKKHYSSLGDIAISPMPLKETKDLLKNSVVVAETLRELHL